MKILFVCTGNTCRSVLAEGYMKKFCKDENIDWIEVKSCGTAAMPTYKVPVVVLSLLKDEGIDVSSHIPTPINKFLVDGSDIILVMETVHKQEIMRRYPECDSRLFLLKEFVGEKENLDIFDPIGQPEEVYIERAEEIKENVKKAFEKILGYRKNL
ncbi:MAG: low molecular weight protein arginine phosphatase [Endomicrobiia bacterium]